MTKKITSFLKKITRSFTPKDHAGKKTEKKEKSSLSYTLYDNCDCCPLWVYISLVCDSDEKALIKEGNPPEDALKEAKMNLLFDFSELISDGESKEQNAIRKIYFYKLQILMLSMFLIFIRDGMIEEISPRLKNFGIRHKDLETTVRQIESKLKSLYLYLKKEQSEYEERNKKEETDEKAKRKDFDMILSRLSKYFAFRITKDITLSEYAAYLKDYNQYLENLKHG